MKRRYDLKVETEFLTPEAEAKWNAWLAKHNRRRRRMGWRGVGLLTVALGVGILILVLVLPMILGAANG